MGARAKINKAATRTFGLREAAALFFLALGPVPSSFAEVPTAVACPGRFASLIDEVMFILDAQSKPTVSLNGAAGTVRWLTPEAQRIIEGSFGAVVTDANGTLLPPAIAKWIQRHVDETVKPPKDGIRTPNLLKQTRGDRETTIELNRNAKTGDWILQVRERSETLVISAIKENFELTPKQAEVLYWVAQGKQDAEIGEILGMAPTTAKKHVENIFKRIGVTNRIQATRAVLRRVPSLDQ